LSKERLDFPFEKEIETMDRLGKSKAKNLLKQWFDFLFENKIETMDRLPKQRLYFPFEKEIERLPKIEGQIFFETTIRF